jgi:hypothetical protein
MVDIQVEWSKIYEGSDYTTAYSVQQTVDGGYIIAGDLSSGNAKDALIIKTDNQGIQEWNMIFGNNQGDSLKSIQQTIDGNYIAVGDTVWSGSWDIWLVKISSKSDIVPVVSSKITSKSISVSSETDTVKMSTEPNTKQQTEKETTSNTETSGFESISFIGSILIVIYYIKK